MTDGKNYLSTRRAAKHLGLSPRTLDRYRVTGGGPVPDLPWLGLKGPLVGPEDVGTDEGARR